MLKRVTDTATTTAPARYRRVHPAWWAAYRERVEQAALVHKGAANA